MTYEMLAEQAKGLSEEKLIEISKYIDYIKYTLSHERIDIAMVENSQKRASKRIGIAKGKINLPDDLDMYDDEVLAAFGDKL